MQLQRCELPIRCSPVSNGCEMVWLAAHRGQRYQVWRAPPSVMLSVCSIWLWQWLQRIRGLRGSQSLLFQGGHLLFQEGATWASFNAVKNSPVFAQSPTNCVLFSIKHYILCSRFLRSILGNEFKRLRTKRFWSLEFAR